MVGEACRDLLIDAQQFSATFSNGLFNHLPMALVALDRLGADDARLRAFAASYSAQLRPKSDAEIALARTLRLGEALPRLSSGVASQAFHGLIRLAYAMDSGVGEEIPDALSAWMSGYSGLPAAGTTKFETFAEALAAIAHDDRLPRDVDGRSITRRIATPAVPFCHLAFSAPRPAVRRYERAKVPAGTLGAAFRERHWSRGLEQWQAAEEIGVSTVTYRNWEVNRSVPTVKHPARRNRVPRLRLARIERFLRRSGAGNAHAARTLDPRGCG